MREVVSKGMIFLILLLFFQTTIHAAYWRFNNHTDGPITAGVVYSTWSPCEGDDSKAIASGKMEQINIEGCLVAGIFISDSRDVPIKTKLTKRSFSVAKGGNQNITITRGETHFEVQFH